MAQHIFKLWPSLSASIVESAFHDEEFKGITSQMDRALQGGIGCLPPKCLMMQSAQRPTRLHINGII